MEQIRPSREHMAMEEDEDYSDITLRLLDLSDIGDFMVWATDEKVSKWCSWNTFNSKEDAINYILDVIVPHPWTRAICLKGRPIGAISVAPNTGNDVIRGELGYVLASEFWGKGIITRAIKIVVSTIFVEWPHLERLEAIVDVENPGSQRVLEKVGFQREGVLRRYMLLKGVPRDVIIFSLLSTDPQVNFFM